ncbi:hypothetical protein ACTOVN_03560 [Arcanobacterium canis]
MDLRDRYVITPKGSSGTLWVSLSRHSKNPDSPHLLPDGSDYGRDGLTIQSAQQAWDETYGKE